MASPVFLSDGWKDFSIIDSGGGRKLERWGGYVLSRPEPQAVWPPRNPGAWQKADAVYHRSKSGGGSWEMRQNTHAREHAPALPEAWNIAYKNLTFKVRPTGFKHTGLFPEQATNWDYMSALIKAATAKKPGREISVLNLFAYTGGATLACASAGARVVHVDAAKGMVAWAKENAALSGLAGAPIRYIVDDCLAFLLREGRRGNRYDAIVMDPPSYGRGPSGQTFRFEDDIYRLLEACAALLSPRPLFLLLNSYTSGFAPQISANALACALPRGSIRSANICLPSENGLPLPCGATARWVPSE